MQVLTQLRIAYGTCREKWRISYGKLQDPIMRKHCRNMVYAMEVIMPAVSIIEKENV